MKQYAKVGENEYEIKAMSYPYNEWSARECISMTFALTPSQLAEIFTDDVTWHIVAKDDDGNIITDTDYSAYSMAGAITDYRNGESSILMGKQTELERMIEIIYGGVNNAD